MKLSIVVPCYASEKVLEKTISEIIEEMKRIEQKEYEIILINDYSPDGTFNVIKKLAEENNWITGVNLSKKFGRQVALMAGFQYVAGDVIICLDDSGQLPASEIYKMIGTISEEIDVVYAKFQVKEPIWYCNIGSKIKSKVMEIMLGKPRDIYDSDFFVAKRYVIEQIKTYQHSFPYIMGLILRTTKKIVNVEVKHRKRKVGERDYSVSTLFILWLNRFTTFSIIPLRIADFIGGTCAALGFVFFVFVIIRRLIFGNSGIVGWSSLISVILFVGGIIMCMLGIMGEYVGRIYMCINKAPQYVVKEIVGMEILEVKEDKK